MLIRLSFIQNTEVVFVVFASLYLVAMIIIAECSCSSLRQQILSHLDECLQSLFVHNNL